MRKLVSFLLILGVVLMAGATIAADYTQVGNLIFRDTNPTMQFVGTLTMKTPGAVGVTYLEIGRTSGLSITINSRTFTNTTGTIYGFQTKPAAGAAGASVTGAEFSPRFNNTFGGVNLIGVQVDPVLKAGTGALTGDFRGIEVNIGDEYSATRSVAGRTAGIQIFHGFNGTLTGGSFGVAMDAAGGSQPYTAAFRFDAQAGLAGGTIGTANPCGGFIEVQIGASKGKVPVCAD